MSGFLHTAIAAMWAAFLAYWAFAARNVKPTRQRESAKGQVVDTVAFLLVFFLLLSGYQPSPLTTRFLPPPGLVLQAAFAVVTALGLALAVWARLHLGGDWAPAVILKEDQALVRTGPYRLIRHPIYSGMLLALGATTLAIGQWRAALAFALAFLALLRRIRAEEKQLNALFPAYDRYRRESAALIPFIF